eukprot:4070590-Pyramimonas_sp.AAC.1
MLGSSEFWGKCSHRAHSHAQFVVECAVCMARHCSECARSSGGWVYVGGLIWKMANDGITHATTALAMHVLTMVPTGEIDVLRVRADDIMIPDEAQTIEHWRSFLNPGASHDSLMRNTET